MSATDLKWLSWLSDVMHLRISHTSPLQLKQLLIDIFMEISRNRANINHALADEAGDVIDGDSPFRVLF